MAILDRAVSRDRLSIVAHSMGSRLVVNYFDWADGRPELAQAGRLTNLILAASDVALDYFTIHKEKLADAAARVTIYASAHDRALYVSEKLHQGPRLGRATPDKLFLDRRMDTVDASSLDKPLIPGFDLSTEIRHSYMFAKERGVGELKQVLVGREPTARVFLSRHERGERIYWTIH
jgi:esterase/lipase superfamily enzyme